MSSVMTGLVCLLSLFGADKHPRSTEFKPVVLMPGLGTHHHPVSTQSLEAQRFFDQGLTLL